MSTTSEATLVMARTVNEAVKALADRGAEAAPFAGGTWIMRGPIRGEAPKRLHVGLARIPELGRVSVRDDVIRLGAAVTHARLVEALAGLPQCSGLVAAAGGAANPAIRNMATLGGNLAAWAFPAADLPPALLCLEALVETHGPRGPERLSIDDYLNLREILAPGTLVTGILIRRRPVLTGHARLPLRQAGDYPVAIVSIGAMLARDGTVEDIRVGVGSVEPSARRWPELETALLGRPLDPDMAGGLARTLGTTFTGRDGVEAPGWYRVQVLPALVRRAARAVLAARPH